jgi:hypothetical protein
MTPFQLRDKAIRGLYPNTVVVSGDKAFDNSGVEIAIDESFISEEISRLEAEQAATQYQRDRAAEYPSIEALVVALWEGVVEERMAAVTALEAIRQQVKARYPKP